MLSNKWFDIDPKYNLAYIDYLYHKLEGMYGKKWSSSYKTSEAIANWRREWGEALNERNIMPDKVKRGLENCLDMYDWPPSLSEFIKACKQPSKNEQAPSTVALLPNEIKEKPIREFKGQISALLMQMKRKRAMGLLE